MSRVKQRYRFLAERIKAHEALRKQQEAWEHDRRREDREDRKVKDEELNGVRLQLRDQAASFATKDSLAALERTIDSKLDAAVERLTAEMKAAIERLNSEGTEGYRESEAARLARDAATKEIISATRQSAESVNTNRRWLIGLIVVVLFGIAGNGLTILGLVIHLLTQ